MSESSFLCPHCGARIAIEARVTQGELPLGPIALKNKLDSQGPTLQAERPRDTIRFGSISESDSFSSHPLAERDSNRIVSERIASCEEDLIESVQAIVGEADWYKHNRGWRSYILKNPRAMANAIEQFKLQSSNYHNPIKRPAAWLNDRYQRELAKMENVQNRKHG